MHLCWIDRRHDRYRSPFNHNYEIGYCQRKDSESHWSKDVILSPGLFYSYSPSMAVEDDQIVVAWSGFREAEDYHSELGPNDIYYVTSKDGGETWTAPLRVTDNVKDGINSREPQVALHKGIIHLFYTHGKAKDLAGQICYQQRSFPN